MSLTEAAEMAGRWPAGWTPEKVREAAQHVQRVPIFRTLWYPDIMKGLEASALGYLEKLGIASDRIHLIDVPGSFELPLCILKDIERCGGLKCDFALALGCIVQGGTPHFEFVSRAAIDGLMRVQLDTRVPIGMGVLTVANLEQARARLDKGAEAAQAAFYVWLHHFQNRRIGKGV